MLSIGQPSGSLSQNAAMPMLPSYVTRLPSAPSQPSHSNLSQQQLLQQQQQPHISPSSAQIPSSSVLSLLSRPPAGSPGQGMGLGLGLGVGVQQVQHVQGLQSISLPPMPSPHFIHSQPQPQPASQSATAPPSQPAPSQGSMLSGPTANPSNLFSNSLSSPPHSRSLSEVLFASLTPTFLIQSAFLCALQSLSYFSFFRTVCGVWLWPVLVCRRALVSTSSA